MFIMRVRLPVYFLICLLITAFNSLAQMHSSQDDAHMHSSKSYTHHHSLRPDEYPPIGVMGGHTHHKGGWMMSYRFMYMSMDGNRNGTTDLSTEDVLQNFMVTPTDMDVWMHMFGLMYAPTDNLTVMGMIPYISKSMNHVTRMGSNFSTKSDGIGDIKLSALYKIFDNNGHQIHIIAGISLPTGSTDEKDDLPTGSNQPLPYPMQLGSGTFDLIPGLTYLGQHNMWSWGAQAMGVVRLGENDDDYSLGNVFNSTIWGARNLSNWLSTATRLNWKIWGNIDGADPRLSPNVVPTADPDRRVGNRLDLLFSLNFLMAKGPALIKGQRFAVEFGLPVYQWLDGPQLETNWLVTFGWRYDWELW